MCANKIKLKPAIESDVYYIIDLGSGDAAKGSIIQSLIMNLQGTPQQVGLVLKVCGGGSHGVLSPDGVKVNFTQWGCGSFLKVPTFLTSRYVMQPEKLVQEAMGLSDVGIRNPFELLWIDPMCLCATFYDAVYTKLMALVTQNDSKSYTTTLGSGVGQAYLRSTFDTDAYTLYAKDLLDREIVEQKLRKKRELTLKNLGSIMPIFRDEEDEAEYKMWYNKLVSEDHFMEDLDDVCQAGEYISQRLVELDRLMHSINGSSIVEQSHGVLADADVGLGSTSLLKTLPECFDQTLYEAGVGPGQIKHYGIHRAYEFRHGYGPMPTKVPDLEKTYLSSKAKQRRWRGDISCGDLDLVQLQYAINCCGGDNYFDGLIITCFDSIYQNYNYWPICQEYLLNRDEQAKLYDQGYRKILYHMGEDLTADVFKKVQPLRGQYYFFCEQKDWISTEGMNEIMLDKELAKRAKNCKPLTQRQSNMKFRNRDVLFDTASGILSAAGIALPLVALSYGSSADRKIWHLEESVL